MVWKDIYIYWLHLLWSAKYPGSQIEQSGYVVLHCGTKNSVSDVLWKNDDIPIGSARTHITEKNDKFNNFSEL